MPRVPGSLCLIVLLLAAGPSAAEETVYSTSSRQDPLQTQGGAARAVAMGAAFVGVADDSSAILFNPAGLAGIRSGEVALHHFSGLAGIRHDIVAMSMPFRERFGFGLYGHYVNYGKFDGYDEQGRPSAGFSASQLGLGAGGGVRLAEGVLLGAAMRGTQQTLQERSYALFNMDAGLLLSAESGWRLGASFCNLGLSKQSTSSATVFRIGTSRSVNLGSGVAVLGAASGLIEPGIGNSLHTGAEGSFAGTYFLRVGYRLKLRETGLDGLQGFTTGAGVAFKKMRLDYAFEPFGDIGATHRVSFVMRFGGERSVSASVGTAATAVMAPAAQSLNAPFAMPQPVTVYVPVQVPQVALPEERPTPSNQVEPEPVTTLGEGDELTIRFEMPTNDVAAGRELEAQGKTEEAHRSYLKAIRADRNNMEAWWRMANIYYRYRMKDQAVRCYEEVLRLKPDNVKLSEWLNQYKAQPAQPAAQTTPAQ